ncbi:MAG TPA: M56 family metallopeptidase, partial [Longimicrobium sp.]
LIAVLAWALYAAAVLARVAAAAVGARAVLGRRRAVTEPAVRGAFEPIARGMRLRGVRLTASARVATPVALGRREICLPERALAELPADEQRGVLAHEAAHLARRDPAWLLLAATLEALFFFQPLNRLARRRLQAEAEYLADDLAAAHLGSGLPLARSLARVAEWLSAPAAGLPRQADLLAPAFAEEPASLVHRVRRLTLGADDAAPARRLRAAGVLSLATAALVLLAAPAFSPGGARVWGTPAFHWEGTLPAGQEVEIAGVMGDIRAEPWSGRRVMVSATRHGRATDPDIAFQVVRHPGGVTICPVYPVPAGHAPNVCAPGVRQLNTRANDVEVEFLVRVPRGVGFTAETATGDVTTGLLSAPVRARSAAGDVDVATTAWASAASAAGDIRVRMGRAAWSGGLGVHSASGDVTVTLPPGASVDVSARSGTGRVRSGFPQISRAAVRRFVGSAAEATLGRGGRRLVVTSTSGDVRIRHSP